MELKVFPAVKDIHLVKLNTSKNTEDNGIPSAFEFDTLSRSLSNRCFSTQQFRQLPNHTTGETFHVLGSFFSFKTKINNYKGRLIFDFKDNVQIQ